MFGLLGLENLHAEDDARGKSWITHGLQAIMQFHKFPKEETAVLYIRTEILATFGDMECRYESQTTSYPDLFAEAYEVLDDESLLTAEMDRFLDVHLCDLEPRIARPAQAVLKAKTRTARFAAFRLLVALIGKSGRGATVKEEAVHAWMRSDQALAKRCKSNAVGAANFLRHSMSLRHHNTLRPEVVEGQREEFNQAFNGCRRGTVRTSTRTRDAFRIFMSERSKDFAEENLDWQGVSKIVKSEWAQLPDVEKQIWRDKAAEEKADKHFERERRDHICAAQCSNTPWGCGDGRFPMRETVFQESLDHFHVVRNSDDPVGLSSFLIVFLICQVCPTGLVDGLIDRVNIIVV